MKYVTVFFVLLCTQAFAKKTTVICDGLREHKNISFHLIFDHQARVYTSKVYDLQKNGQSRLLKATTMGFSPSSYLDSGHFFEMLSLSQSGFDYDLIFQARASRNSLSLRGRPIALERPCRQNQKFLDEILAYVEKINEGH